MPSPPRRPVSPPLAVPLAIPGGGPVAARPTAGWKWVFRGTFGLMLILGFTVGFVAGSPRPVPPAKTVAVAAARAAKAEPSLPLDSRPEPNANPVEARVPEAKPPEAEPPEPKTTPEVPAKKPESKPDPKPEKSPSPAKPTGEVTFARVAPIFKDKCGVCHGGANAKGGLDLRSAKAALQGGDSGEGLKPGDPDNSLIWQMIAEGTMPPKGKP